MAGRWPETLFLLVLVLNGDKLKIQQCIKLNIWYQVLWCFPQACSWMLVKRRLPTRCQILKTAMVSLFYFKRLPFLRWKGKERWCSTGLGGEDYVLKCQIIAPDLLYLEKWERGDSTGLFTLLIAPVLLCLCACAYLLSDKRLWKLHQQGITLRSCSPLQMQGFSVKLTFP